MSADAVAEQQQPAPTLYSRALPSTDDISEVAAYWSGVKKVRRLLAYVTAGIPVWWRRPGFHDPQFREAVPKWHVLRARQHPAGATSKWEIEWVAQCGYRSNVHEAIDNGRDFRKTPPAKSERCKKCVEALDQIKRDAAAAVAKE